MSLEQSIADYLSAHQSVVVAGQLPSGPYAGTTCFVSNGKLGIYFFVFKNSEKHQLVTQGKEFSMVVDEGFKIPFKGVEAYGKAKVLTGEEAATAQSKLAGTFPKLGNVWGHPAISVCVFEPSKVIFHNWEVKVGHVEIWGE